MFVVKCTHQLYSDCVSTTVSLSNMFLWLRMWTDLRICLWPVLWGTSQKKKKQTRKLVRKSGEGLFIIKPLFPLAVLLPSCYLHRPARAEERTLRARPSSASTLNRPMLLHTDQCCSRNTHWINCIVQNLELKHALRIMLSHTYSIIKNKYIY